jgi:lipopolysaccharide/colanic/teichoic acid biosynthesis glycosyltransferase
MLVFRRLFSLPRLKPPSDFLLGSTQFQRVLERERSRADRTGNPFSIVAIRLQEREQTRLAARITRRLRVTDVAGWLADGRLGILLADTAPGGAERFCDYLQTQVAEDGQGEIPNIELIFYPSPESGDTADFVGTMVDETSSEVVELPQVFLQPLPIWKRWIDILGACVGLMVLAPLLGITALAIRLTSPGPIIFRQQRIGLGGRAFWLYKFRTMCIDAEQKKADLIAENEQDGPAFKMKNDPRVTPLGRFLRKACIDELPQLLNVLKGDMTLVGPRPLPGSETAGCRQWERRRLDVTPGMTCIWQAGGRRVSFPEWMRMDIRYLRKRTLWHDIKLIWKTFVKVVFFRASH